MAVDGVNELVIINDTGIIELHGCDGCCKLAYEINKQECQNEIGTGVDGNDQEISGGSFISIQVFIHFLQVAKRG
jgi:hypothetical protein